jgi:hypothetical protein
MENNNGNNVDIGSENTEDHNLIGVDPKFIDASNGDFHLQSDSPAINAGVPTIIKDIEGTSRPQGPSYDIGAYEYFSGVP